MINLKHKGDLEINGNIQVTGGTITIDGNPIGGGLEGTQYVFVAANGTDIENAVELQEAYDLAKTMSPTADNRITVVATPGTYKFPSTFVMDTEYIDLVSLTGNRDVVFDLDVEEPFQFNEDGEITSFGEIIKIIEDNIILIGVQGKNRFSESYDDYWGNGTDYKLPIRIINNLPNLYIKNCNGGDFGFGSNENFWNSLSEPVVVSGTFIDCEGGFRSFGNGSNANPSGTFINCNSFQINSFGNNSNASGYFENCKLPLGFGFGGFGESSGTFINCSGGDYLFPTIASGVFTNCVAGGDSFGGTLTGKLFYCRLTLGTFKTVSSGGRTYYCVDGNGNPNNQ